MSVSLNQNEEGDSCIQQQLCRLRHEDPTQYHTLVKMHLSFATDLPTHQCDLQGSEQTTSGRRWQLTPLIKKLGRTAAPVKGVMEGAPLTQEGVCQAFQLIHYLNKDSNIVQEGLFRKSGSLSRQQELKNLLNSGGDLNLDYGTYSAHDCASVLKSFLADLPEPLLTEGHYPIHCRIAEMGRRRGTNEQEELAQGRQVKALRLVFLLLPPENYQLLHDLLVLLHRVASHQNVNLMSAINLGTMFAPHILCPRKMTPNDLQYLSGTLSTAVAFMIEQVPQLFQVPLELEYDVLQYWNNKKKMRHQLSKRSMMDAPANTIFTFIDRELTAQANDKDVTEVALAELYAYVQSLPDSTKKRKLIKQFNTATGSGTPQLNQSVSKKQEARSKRLGESIKKHLFHKTAKPSKGKCQPFSSSDFARVKRTNSEDLLSSPSTRSPELRMFRHNPEYSTPSRLKAKSLEDLSSSFCSQLSITKSSCLSYITHPILHPNYALLKGPQQKFFTTSLEVETTPSLIPCDQNFSKDTFSPVVPPSLSLDSSCDTLENRVVNSCQPLVSDNIPKEIPNTPITFSSNAEEECKENTPPWNNIKVSTPTNPQLEVHSPISQAVLRASIPQKVIMTPRSRCPIIFNSTTSLSSVTIPEEKNHQLLTPNSTSNIQSDISQEDLHTSPVITNPAALLQSPRTRLISEETKSDVFENIQNSTCSSGDTKSGETKLSRWGSLSFRRTLSSASSTASLFGNFFHHLSTTSLTQLATRLTSSSSSSNINNNQAEEVVNETEEEEGEGDMNESLSSVFKGYLLSRSILTDSPVDLSFQCADTESKVQIDNTYYESEENDDQEDDTEVEDSAYGNSQPSSNSTSRQCSKGSLKSLDSAVEIYTNKDLSESLLYCLDGNNPLKSSPLDKSQRWPIESTRQNFKKEKDQVQDTLHSCSPDSRQQSLLKTKQGTPVPQREIEDMVELGNAKGVLFETSF
ncbi:hypothetical protein Pcinc_016332 [Petrolisthes cinctipes]|uniref:Rho-GAP domain-containing protein n=1 Tax=Petrolisthes cinctipes TaxID=88211 RepID=A0AAE1FWH2_PETCI|nr:hypothetical protein Pcinc_016332 [Petrolisthes cinctipes]